MTTAQEFSIGEIAKRANVRPSALRYYESVGLIRPQRRVNSRRVYDATVFESLALIQLAQEAGFTIDEVKLLLNGFERATPASLRWQSLAKKKLDEMTARIERAQQMKDLLGRLLRCQCETLGQCVRKRVAILESQSST